MNGRQVLMHFLQMWEQKFGKRYPVAWGKDTAIFNRLLQLYPGPGLLEIVRYYLVRHNGTWSVKCGYSVNALVAELPVILTSMADEAQKKAKAEEINPDFDRLERARREEPK